VDGEFSPIIFLTSSSFQNTSYHWIKRFSSYSLGAKFVLGTMAGTTVLYTQYPARVTNISTVLSGATKTFPDNLSLPAYVLYLACLRNYAMKIQDTLLYV
jgi:hypothetical protein